MILKDAGKVIDYAFDAQSFIDTHAKRITDHYLHAREKHPYFCDKLTDESHQTFDSVVSQLGWLRLKIELDMSHGVCEASDVLECEILEALEAIHKDDTAHAVEELYDCITVCLRKIDVLEGRQKLGRPETISGNSAGSKKENKQ